MDRSAAPQDDDAPMRFDGLTNLRDLGGRPASQGRWVRRGRLYRSESLDDPTESDRQRLASLQIRSICDLRGPRESALRPSRIPGAVHHPMPIETRFEEVTGVSGATQAASVDADLMTRFMQGIYDALPRLAAPHLARMIGMLLDDASAPVLFHCTAGKDRTGFAAAVLLRLLEVPWPAIEADYLATRDALATAVHLARPVQ
jgi:protein-tyrosine phosphatase